MLRILFLIISLLASPANSTEVEDRSVDWKFECRTRQAGESNDPQPCWIQSEVVRIKFRTDIQKTGLLYFQVHFFEKKVVLRVLIERDSVTELQIATRRKGEEYLASFDPSDISHCDEKECWGDLVVTDETVTWFASEVETLSLFGKDKDSLKNSGWAYYDVITLNGFGKSAEILRAYMKLTTRATAKQ
jgi:hypothetical protein